MSTRQAEFLNKLADLCEEYDAGFYYTREDDGINISIGDDDEAFIGYISEDAPRQLREAAKLKGG